MAKKLSPVGALSLKADAFDLMIQGRASKGGRLARSVRRSWNYGEGKKNVIKFGVGMGVATGLAAVGVATHGVGIPIIVGLAAGGLAVGKLSDTAFAKLWGRQYTGGERTRAWIGTYKQVDTAGATQVLEERAHKTIRRAFQHYRTAWEKAQQFRAPQKPFATCDEAIGTVTELLHILRHLDKARLYVYPAIFLADAALQNYEFRLDYTDQPNEVANAAWHPDGACDSKTCYLHNTLIGSQGNPGVALWSAGQVKHAKKELEDAKALIATDPTITGATPFTPNLDRDRLYHDAETKYANRSMVTKVRHGISNPWERKTNSEQASFVAKHVVSVGLAAGGAGTHAGADEILGGFAAGVDELFAFADVGTAEGADELDAERVLHDIEKHREGAKSGKESQESLRKAAIHLLEVYNVTNEINKEGLNEIGDCDDAVEYLRQVYKILHHLSKTEGYLHETIEKVTKLTEKINADIVHLTKFNGAVRSRVDLFMNSGNHSNCTHDLCYKKGKFLT
jgi:hypothetical protein